MTALVLMLTGVMLLLLHELANSVLLCGHFCVHNTGQSYSVIFQVLVSRSSNSLVLADGGGKC